MESVESNEKDPLDNYVDWSIYRGDKKGNQYSELAQIHAANVHKLKPVWQYRTGDANRSSSMQCNPVVIDGLLYISTASLNVMALEPDSGKEVWVFNSSNYNEENKILRGRSRGVVYWQSENGDNKRLFHFVKNRVYAIDAKNGKLVSDFGEKGHIDLRKNLGIDYKKASLEATSPGIVYKDYLIVSSRVPEGYDSTPGHIRAFDAMTGEFRWRFNTIPKEGEFGFDTWEFKDGESYGGANAWGGLTVDEERGWVFCATGSPTYDFYGANRKGRNLFGNCVLALDATTGKRIWHYQTVHHDLWDYDNPPAPILVTLTTKEDEKKDAVVQFTKMGLTFVLDRETGEPLFPVDEMPVPASDVFGEEAWPTQPIPRKPSPLTRLGINESDLTNITPQANKHALNTFKKYVSGSFYTPPTTAGTIMSPGHQGGVEWGGGSFDPYSNIIYVNSNDVPIICKLQKISDEKNDLSEVSKGKILYERNCSVCHGVDKKGVPPLYPALDSLSLSNSEVAEIIRNGRNIMPAFTQLSDKEINRLSKYLKEDLKEELAINITNSKFRYVQERYERFVDDRGYPAIAPPWSTLTAIDLISGDFVWQVPLGEYPELVKKGIRNTGTPSFGGPVVTAGGLVFIAATADEKIRAFSKSTGECLWEYQLPAGGYATPAVYAVDGKQYLVIMAAGGGKNRTKSSDHLIAFALPDDHGEVVNNENLKLDEDGWITLFDGETLDGWVHMNNSQRYTVENGAIIGRTVAGSRNSFLCSKTEFADFELECDVMVDTLTNQGIQFRSSVRPVTEKDHHQFRAGRVWGPQIEIRQKMGDSVITTGLIYGEALGTGYLSSDEKMKDSHDFYVNKGWNRIRLLAEGPRMRTYVNGQLVEDLVNEEVYKTHPKGFIGLQVHGIEGERQFVMGWKNIRVRPIP